MPPSSLAPASTQRDFEAICRCSSHITFNSLAQFERFEPLVRDFERLEGRKISLGLRINPEFEVLATDLYNPCAPGSRLGVAVDQLPAELPAAIDGLHFHALCESSSFDLEQALAAIEAKFGHYLSKIKWFNMGGGHLMTRQGYDVDHLVGLLTTFRQKWGMQVILEPGSAFAWDTGVLVSEVVDIVENRGIKTAILDVSFTGHMPDCLEMPYKPRIRGAHHEPVADLPTYRIGGNSCLSGDFIGDWSFDAPLKVGDKLVFEDMIHYTMVKTTTFNGVPHPAIAIWRDASGLQVVRRFGYEDYKNRLS